MATFSEIRSRIEAVAGTVEGLTVVTRPGESAPAALPALVIQEPTVLLAEGDSSRGLDNWDVPLLLLVSMGDYSLAADALDAYLVRRGAKSIRQAFADDPGLGLLDGTRAYLDRMDDYGPRQSGGGDIRMAGAVLHLIVRTSG